MQNIPEEISVEPVRLRWWTADQNNSGGYYIENQDVAAYVLVQARSVQEAQSRIKPVLSRYFEFCYCCGQRWSTDDWTDEDGTSEPTIYGKPLDRQQPAFRTATVVMHHYDGSRSYSVIGRNRVRLATADGQYTEIVDQIEH